MGESGQLEVHWMRLSDQEPCCGLDFENAGASGQFYWLDPQIGYFLGQSLSFLPLHFQTMELVEDN